jgi:RNA recognition motif-containing protein
MSARLYVGNLPYNITQDAIQAHFATVGDVTEVKIMTDRESGQPRGFGFVEMGSAQLAQSAVASLNGKELMGRSLRVDIAEERRPGGGGGFGGGREGGGGRDGRRGGR